MNINQHPIDKYIDTYCSNQHHFLNLFAPLVEVLRIENSSCRVVAKLTPIMENHERISDGILGGIRRGISTENSGRIPEGIQDALPRKIRGETSSRILDKIFEGIPARSIPRQFLNKLS